MAVYTVLYTPSDHTESYPSPHPLDPVVATASQSVAALDHADPPFTTRAPRLGAFEPTLFFPATSLLTARVPIGNGNIFHSQGFGFFFIHPRIKPSVGGNPSWNSTQFALMGFDRWQQQTLIARALFEHFIVSDDLVLCFLQFDGIAKLVRLRRLSFPYDLGVGFKQTQEFVRKLRDALQYPGFGLPHHSTHLVRHCFQPFSHPLYGSSPAAPQPLDFLQHPL